MSQIHARIVALVLSVSTVKISPQFHVTLDTFFATINVCGGYIVTPRY